MARIAMLKYQNIAEEIAHRDFEDWWKSPPRMYIGRDNLPHVCNNRIHVGPNGPCGPQVFFLKEFGYNSTFILFCMYFGLIDLWNEGIFINELAKKY